MGKTHFLVFLGWFLAFCVLVPFVEIISPTGLGAVNTFLFGLTLWVAFIWGYLNGGYMAITYCTAKVKKT